MGIALLRGSIIISPNDFFVNESLTQLGCFFINMKNNDEVYTIFSCKSARNMVILQWGKGFFRNSYVKLNFIF